MAGVDLTMLLRRVADLSARLDTAPALRWGTVQSTSPLTVLLDGDTQPVAGLGALTSPAAGSRVLVARWNRRGVILGSPGAPATAIRADLGGMLVAWDGTKWLRVAGGTLATSLSTSLSETTLSGAAGPRGMAGLTFTLPVRATVRLVASAHVVPSGLAAGSVGIYRSNVAGTRVALANWHSRGSASHQFPRCEVVLDLPAGSYGYVVGVATSAGSSSTTFYYPVLSATYA